MRHAREISRMILLLMAGLAGAACDSVSGTPVSMDAVVLELTPAEVVLAPGTSTTLRAKARNSVGVPVQVGLKWRSSDPEIVTVDDQGNVTALRAGEAEVQAVYGKSTGDAKIRVAPESSGDSRGVASVTLTPGTASLKAIGDTVRLTASALNAAGAPMTGAEVGWASLDEMVATVSAGTVVARGNGTARITATAGGKVDTAVVTVAQAPVSVSVMPGAVSVLPGQSVQLAAVAVDANGVSILGHSFTWASEDEGIATVEAGKVVAVTTGSTVVRATSGSLSGAATVAVQSTPVATVAVSPASGYIEVGQTGQLTVTLKDASGKVLTGRAVTWTSSNGSVATVSSTGAVTGASAGTTTITATSEGKTGTATLEVRAPAPASVASVTVSPGSASVEKGKTVALSAVARDASGNVLTGRAVSWSSSNAAVATVSAAGSVTAVAAGTATIVATSEGKNGSASITVTVPATTPVAVASVTLSPGSVSVEKGKSATFSATLRDASGNVLTGRTVTWTSSNPPVATVTSSGVASAVGAGTATVAATVEGKTGYATMTVTEPSTGGGGDGSVGGLLASHGFTDGTWGPYANSYAASDLWIADDPTGAGRGKVAAIKYNGNLTRGFKWDVRKTANEVTFGESVYFRGRFHVDPAAGENIQRKLSYWFTSNTSVGFIVLSTWGKTLKAEVRNAGRSEVLTGTNGTTSLGTINWKQWHTLEIGMKVNSSPTTADGALQVWLDGTLVMDQKGLILINQALDSTGAAEGFELFMTGDQVSGGNGAVEYRYWDDVAFGTSRVGL